MMTETNCLKRGDTFGTIGYAKYACSQDKQCVGIENPNCDSLISRLCFYAVYKRTDYASTPDEIPDRYINCTYMKAEQYGKKIFCCFPYFKR